MKKPTANKAKIIDRFSDEQRVQIRRLTLAGQFADADETIAELAEAALYVFGLDPIAEDSYGRIAKVVFATDVSADGELSDVILNEMREAANAWTKAQRTEERAAAHEGRSA